MSCYKVFMSHAKKPWALSISYRTEACQRLRCWFAWSHQSGAMAVSFIRQTATVLRLLPGHRDAVQSRADRRPLQSRRRHQSAPHSHWTQTGHTAASLRQPTAGRVLDPNCNAHIKTATYTHITPVNSRLPGEPRLACCPLVVFLLL